MQNNYRNVSRGDVSKTQSSTVGRRGATTHSKENFPIEVTMLLDVLSRIESRRQARLLVVEKEVC